MREGSWHQFRHPCCYRYFCYFCYFCYFRRIHCFQPIKAREVCHRDQVIDI